MKKEDARETSVRLWTIQSWKAWESFQEKETLRTDGRYVFAENRRAYRWMIEQMRKRIQGYHGHYPIWAWYRPKPDLRQVALLERGTRGARIEFAVPSNRVLLSDFDGWHEVLNGSYLSLNEKEDRAWERQTSTPPPSYESLSPKLMCVVEKTWERIFDLETPRDLSWWGSLTYVQATLAEVYLDEVVKVQPFTAR